MRTLLLASLGLLQHLVGHWTMTGEVRGKAVTYTLEAAPTLRGKYVELHMTDAATPSTYEARLIVGDDTIPDHYIAHWLDSYGAAYSVPPATGVTRGDTLSLDFPYPTGVFHDTFVYDRASDTWVVRFQKADGTLFANYRLVRRRLPT